MEHGMDYDIFVIGGGINGCGIARDAAGRGYSVCLAEMNDLGSGTSSWSSKLIHGGLRYLEHYEFGLVRKALGEREVLMRAAPHMIRPMRFVLPQKAGLRSGWLLRIGLFLYDHLGKRKLLPGTRDLDLRKDAAGGPLKDDYAKGYEYSDCHVPDARLVVSNAVDAARHGADIEVRTRVVEARRHDGHWHIAMQDERTGERREVTARLVVNAGGPWVDRVLSNVTARNDVHNVRMVQGSHIVTRKLFDHGRAYIVQNDDGRIVFLIPYEDDYTLIGTTDRDYEGDPGEAVISPEETRYLLDVANQYLKAPIGEDDIVWTYSGVRPLFDDGASAAQEATRDYVLREETDGEGGGAPMVNIFGGKLTTYRQLSIDVVERIEKLIGAKKPSWTADAPLPGGEFAAERHDEKLAEFCSAYPFLGEKHARRLFRNYGTDAWTVMGEARSHDDLGELYGADLYETEVRFLTEREFATTAEDVLWRRTKLGLAFDPEAKARLEERIGAGGKPAFQRAAE